MNEASDQMLMCTKNTPSSRQVDALSNLKSTQLLALASLSSHFDQRSLSDRYALHFLVTSIDFQSILKFLNRDMKIF